MPGTTILFLGAISDTSFPYALYAALPIGVLAGLLLALRLRQPRRLFSVAAVALLVAVTLAYLPPIAIAGALQFLQPLADLPGVDPIRAIQHTPGAAKMAVAGFASVQIAAAMFGFGVAFFGTYLFRRRTAPAAV